MSINIKRMRITTKDFKLDTTENQNQKNLGGKKTTRKKVGLLNKVEFRTKTSE